MLSKAAWAGFLVYVVSLALMQPALSVAGHKVQISDAVFPLVALLTAAAVVSGQIRLRWHRGLLPVAAFLAASAAATLLSEDPGRSAVKLAGRVYLALVAAVALVLVTDERRERGSALAWIGATAVVSAVGTLSAVLFYADRGNPLLEYTLFHFGTLPPGEYPRLKSTFLNANMLCNFLSVSFPVLAAAYRNGWIGRTVFVAVTAAAGLTALLTISPGLGGVALGVGLWFWHGAPRPKPFSAKLTVTAAAAAAVLFVAAAAVSPRVDPEAPGIRIAGLTLQPSARLVVLADAAATIGRHPLFGRGPGLEAARANYDDLSGIRQTLTDAHNTFANVTADTGIFGGAAILWMMAVFSVFKPAELRSAAPGERWQAALGIAFVSAFVYQGLTGSFEDARHLWVLAGLIMAAGSNHRPQ
jgi:O-antigen ligase